MIKFFNKIEDNMETTDLFRETLKSILAVSPDITQTEIADGVGIAKSQLNDFIHNRKNFSEKRLRKIADFLGRDYYEMLDAGYQKLYQRSMFSPPDSPTFIFNIDTVIESITKLSKEDLKLVNDLILRLLNKTG